MTSGTTPLISIILLNFNNGSYTKKCLQSIYSSTYQNFEVVVVDNNSSDGSPDDLILEYSNNNNFKLVKNSTNLGFAEGNNIGVKASSGDIFFILNNDTEIKNDCLEELVKFFETHPEAGVVQSKILELKDKKTIQLMGSYFAPTVGWTFPLSGRGIPDNGQYDNEYREATASGAALAILKKCYEKTGLFDADYFICYEDLDVSLKAFLAGFKTLIAPRSIVYHHDHQSNVLSPFQRRMRLYVSYKNFILTVLKDFELQHTILYLLSSSPFMLCHALLYSLKNRDLYGFAAFCKAIYWNLINLPRSLEKRRFILINVRTVPDRVAYSNVVKTISIPKLISLIRTGTI